MQPAQEVFVRGRCVCGRRYRIRHPRAGLVVNCPACGRPIPICEADIRAAQAGTSLTPLQDPGAEPKEAILIDAGQLRLARRGSQPGLTGGAAPGHADSALLRGPAWPVPGPLADLPPAGAGGPGAPGTAPGRRRARSFVDDLLASFYFAGSRSNALNVLATAGGCGVVLLICALLPGLLAVIGLVLGWLVLLYLAQFYWSLLGRTAAGEDELPWFEADWDLWDDALKPLLWLATISGLCSLPAVGLGWYLPDSYAFKVQAICGALAAGWFLWPVAVMSLALGQSLLFLRPDWLVRCAAAIGPVYLLAWLLVVVVLLGWVAFFHYYERLAALPLVGVAVSLYFGYVLFRMLGLLFRHFRDRFPWKL